MRLYKPGVLALALGLLAGLTASGPAAAEETKTVSYRGYQVTVPARWPVVDLAASPSTCVRFDRPAVYLGRSTAQADCPAHLVGRSEGLVLEPLTSAPSSSEGLLRRAIADAGVLATAYYAPGEEQAASDVLATGRVVSKSQSARIAQPALVTPSVVATGNFTGNAFDTCTAPSQAAMDAWQPDYKAAGVYISGALRACDQPNLTADWVSANAAKGWKFLLIDVGLQAPCTTYSSRMSTVPGTALAQGRTAAFNAVTAAKALGFAPRSAIYSDIEAYTSTAACKASVLSYLSGWTQQMIALGYVGGAYVGAASGGADLASVYTSTAYTRPDNIWFAHWGSTPTGTSRFIPATYWTNHQRVHQYVGNASETHGGVKMSIDKNWVDVTAPPPPVTGFAVTGSAASAALRWTNPANTTIGQIIVRSAAGSTPPALPTSGTLVYAGTASSATATGLANSASYAYRAWVKDSTGKIGPGADVRLVGTKATITSSAAALMYTGSVTLSTTITRLDAAAKLSGVRVILYSKAKNATKWSTAATLTADANGAVTSVRKPTVSTYYMWGYNGGAGLLGTRSAAALVQVRPAMSAYLSPAAIKLGAATLFYGYLNPPHAGTTVYLQRRSGTSWVAVTTTKLTTTGKYSFSIKPTARGTYTYRVVWLADADHQGTQTPSKVLTVS
ncbi:glycoside hydrolase domain-containing protein [Kribbella sp. NPDC050241]|uniref:glycoside hydrolase domain-containing protein n=1 Tax=Kribbella sp. NPDC050241 TaxID=3364115 RepID=UPI0037A88B36